MDKIKIIKIFGKVVIQEAEKLGFSTIFVSKYNKISLKNTFIKVKLVSKIEDVASELFE